MDSDQLEQRVQETVQNLMDLSESLSRNQMIAAGVAMVLVVAMIGGGAFFLLSGGGEQKQQTQTNQQTNQTKIVQPSSAYSIKEQDNDGVVQVKFNGGAGYSKIVVTQGDQRKVITESKTVQFDDSKGEIKVLVYDGQSLEGSKTYQPKGPKGSIKVPEGPFKSGSQIPIQVTTNLNSSNVVFAYDINQDSEFELTGVKSPNRTVSFTSVGEHKIRVRITNTQTQASTVVSENITISNQKPTVAITTTPQTNFNVNETITISAENSQDPEGQDLSIQWDVDGDGQFEKSGTKVTVTYQDVGTHEVTVKVSDGYSNVTLEVPFQVAEAVSKTTTNNTTVKTKTEPITGTTGAQSRDTESVSLSVSMTTSPDVKNINEEVTFKASGGAETYEWDLGDGTSVKGQIVKHAYSKVGDYEVKLIGRSGNKTATATKTIDIKTHPPEATLEVEETGEIVVGETVDFNANVSDKDDSSHTYTWKFGDGDSKTTTVSETNTVYESAGTYTVEVTVEDPHGATDTATATVEVNHTEPLAKIDDSTEKAFVNKNLTLSAYDSQSVDGEIVEYTWQIEGRSNVTTTDPTYKTNFSAVGNYTYNVTVTTEYGLSDTSSNGLIKIRSQDPVINSFDTGKEQINVSENVTFSVDATDPEGKQLTYIYHFDNGDKLNTTDSSIVYSNYTTAGHYDPWVVVKDPHNNKDAARINLEVNGAPTVSLPDNRTITDDTIYEFNASWSDPDDSVDQVGFFWEFGDGNSGLTADSTVKYRYTELGNYTMNVTIKDDNGLTDTATINVSVVNHPPTAKWAHKPQDKLTDDQKIYFSAEKSSDPDPNDALGYKWYFDDGTTKTGKTVSHTYSSFGTYDVKLKVMDEHGATNTKTKTLNVTNHKPIAKFEKVQDKYPHDDVFTFTAKKSKDIDGDKLLYKYRWGDGTSTNFTTKYKRTHTYNSVGEYTVTMTVKDEHGATNTTKMVVDFNNHEPTAQLYAEPNPATDEINVTFYGNKSSDIDGQQLEYKFKWGDGTSTNFTTDSIRNHSYSKLGDYQVTLVVRDPYGVKDSEQITLPVENNQPTAGLSAIPQLVQVGENVTLDATSSYDPDDFDVLTYNYTFGDGTSATSAGNKTKHSYDTWGTYNATVDVTDNHGASDNKTVKIEVNAQPNISNVSVTDSPDNNNSTIYLTYDGSDPDGDSLTYNIEWGDGTETTTSKTNVSHDYGPGGSYTITITAKDGDRASDSGSDGWSYDNLAPHINDLEITTSNLTATVDANNITDPEADNIKHVKIEWGDGNTTYAREADHTYSSSGNYTITVTVVDEYGNARSYQETVSVS